MTSYRRYINASGRQLQLRHDLPHATLLRFDGEVEMRDLLTGVTSDEALRCALEIHLERWAWSMR